MIIVDTSGLLAAIDHRSDQHEPTKALLDDAKNTPGTFLLLSPFVLTEVDYLLSQRLKRPDTALEVLYDVARGAYRLQPFSGDDIARAAEIMKKYADNNVGLADASNVVLAERHNTLDILTFDERHFRVLRGPKDKAFRLLPIDQ